MIGKTYIITSKTAGGEIVFKYHLNGFLIGLEVNAELTFDAWQRLVKNFPFKIEIMEHMASENKNIKLLPEDLSFERFWNAYNYKEGKKVMAQNAWNKLIAKDKLRALQYISYYNHKLTQTGVAKAYPSTYLNQKYWTNED